VRLSGHDVYLNVAGGLRIAEPAADLAVAAALVSSLSGTALPQDAVYFGEISLTGAVRAVPQAPARIKEAVKLGFARAVLPDGARGEVTEGIAVSPVASLDRLVAEIAARAPRGLRAAAGRDDG
jgi:DNA repair protein RadA/Sms